MVSVNSSYVIGALLGFVLYYSAFLAYQHFYANNAASHPSKLEKLDRRNIPSVKDIPIADHRQNPGDITPSSIIDKALQKIHEYADISTQDRSIDLLVHPSSTPTFVPLNKGVNDVSGGSGECASMMAKYHVAPGSSWGTLPTELQRHWTKLACDVVVGSIGRDATGNESPEDLLPAVHSRDSNKPPLKPSKDSHTGLLRINEDFAEWCLEAKQRYHVQPMKSWGNLPGNIVATWQNRRCDMVFTTRRMSKRPISSCLTNSKPLSKLSSHPNMNTSLPLIAVMAASTTRRVKSAGPETMALFLYLLPSFTRTLDCGFRYEYVLGYDSGDPYYDSKQGMQTTKAWFAENVETPLKNNAIQASLRPVKVNNIAKKPGPVFIAMARAAYNAGATYFYRVNDDTEFLSNWPTLFTNTLASLSPPNIGAIGPACQQGNDKILTHDFVHRVHMEIFTGNYYPPMLTDWWMDDWISFVYGSQRTFKSSKTPVLHHTGIHGQRYEVDHSNEQLLPKLITEGRGLIHSYILKHYSQGESSNVKFDKAESQRFIHKDVPASVINSLPTEALAKLQTS